MTKQRVRKVKLQSCPEVEAYTHSDMVHVTVNGWSGSEKMECTGDLSIYCAKHLILKLRKALRKVRDDKTQMLNAQVLEAEQPL